MYSMKNLNIFSLHSSSQFYIVSAKVVSETDHPKNLQLYVNVQVKVFAIDNMISTLNRIVGY